MEDFELVGPNGTDVNNEFLKQYRDALKNQYDASLSSLKQQNRNNQASIMSAANERGMMYSNFPQRSKIQAETDYLSNASKLHSTYQTGLDKLRSNAVNAYNQIKSYEEAISDLNSASGGSGSGSGGTGGTSTTTTTGQNPGNTTEGDYDIVDHVPGTNNGGTTSKKEDNPLGLGDNIGGGIIGTGIGARLGSGIGTLLLPGGGIWAPVLGGLAGGAYGAHVGSNWGK